MSTEEDELPDLLFFDTFSHEINELNLDLVQFPRPVHIREIRIIPLGAKVQLGDFPGGVRIPGHHLTQVRLGATNPSNFHIDFFVNDLSKPGAATFEKLGTFEYNQKSCINMPCEVTVPTDGLVLRGLYTTITLAVYGVVTQNVLGQIASPNINAASSTEKLDTAVVAVPDVVEEDADPQFFPNPDTSLPKDPRQFHEGGEWSGTEVVDAVERPRERSSRISRRSSIGPNSGSRGRRGSYSRSSSPEDVFSKHSREWSRSPEYRSTTRRSSRNSGYESRRDSSFERRVSLDDLRKRRPRTPPQKESVSPVYARPPRSPTQQEEDVRSGFHKLDDRLKAVQSPTSTTGTPLLESPAAGMDDDMVPVEQFEPILSDEEIGDDLDQFDLNYYEEYEESLRIFNPLELQKFESQVEEKRIAHEFEIFVKILTKFKLHCSGVAVDLKCFSGLSTEDKETWVHSVEKLNQCLTHVHQFSRSLVGKHVELLLKDWRNVLLNWILVGIDYNCAMSQTAYKVRHIKAGVRFVELFACFEPISRTIFKEEQRNIFNNLFDLYSREFMAISIQVMILKAMSTTLDTKDAVEFFLEEDHYKDLLHKIEINPKIYLKLSLKGILKKLNIYEGLELIQQSCQNLTLDQIPLKECEMDLLKSCLSELYNCYLYGELSLAYSKHFVPVPQKIEISKDYSSIRGVGHFYSSYFDTHAFLESLLVLTTNRSVLEPALGRCVLDILKAISRNPYGFLYLAENIQTSSLLVRCLIQSSSNDDWTDISNEWLQVGLEIAYKIQTKYYLDAIQNLSAEFDVADHLMALFNLTLNFLGRPYVLEAICMHDGLSIILKLIDREKQKLLCLESSTKYKSPILSYSVDILDCVVRHGMNVNCLQKNKDVILSLVKSYDIFESNVSAMLQELAIYLRPFENPKSILAYDDVVPLCDLIKRSFEFFITFPGDLIICLRIARFLAIPEFGEDSDDDDWEDQQEYKEMKYKLFITQFYAADGYMLLVSILEKMVAHFQQPKMHSSNLVGIQGVLVMDIVLPTLQVLRRVLNAVITTRNIDFRDITAVKPLLQTYNLMHNIPASALAFPDAQKAQGEIVKILLCYTKPKPPDGVDTESVMKSLWTQVVGEVIKSTLDTPLFFITGLMIFSELLPLPLPILTPTELSDKEVNRLLTERQLWSAHLHPQSNAISDLIQTLCPTSYTQLSVLLSRVCLQLSDLGPNMSLIVTKSILDLILAQTITNGIASSHQYRLINFLSNLTCYPSIKISVLSMINGKLLDLYNTILTTTSSVQNHIQTQMSILDTFQNLLDCENTILSSAVMRSNKELALACVIPQVEHLNTIVDSCIENFCLEGAFSSLAALRVLMIYTEHDVTTTILRISIDKRKSKIGEALKKIVSNVKENNEDSKQIMAAFLELLSLLINIEPVANMDEITTPIRQTKLNKSQLGSVINFVTETEVQVKVEDQPSDDKTKIQETIHPLLLFNAYLEANPSETNTPILDSCKQILTFLEKEEDSSDPSLSSDAPPEMVLPQAEGIVTQFTSRQVCSLMPTLDERKHLLERNYWLSSPNYDEYVLDMEQVSCDLSELAKTCLASDTNLISDCKRVLNLSVSPQTNRERTVAAPCFRTRRVEVEPMTGRPEKKIFVSSMRGRGFARTPPNRGDLFRSRPPNTSRPPSLHVDDFLALETCGAQPTGPTGYNKMSRDIIGISRGRGRGRGFDKNRIGGPYRSWNTTQSSSSPAGQTGDGQSSPHFRTATQEPVHYPSDGNHYHNHFTGASRGRFSRGFMRTRTFPR